MEKIVFSRSYISYNSIFYIKQALEWHVLYGDGEFTKKCQYLLEEQTQSKAILCNPETSALNMATILANINTGDEVIITSYTFTSTAIAVVMSGGVSVFMDWLDYATADLHYRKNTSVFIKSLNKICAYH